MKLFLGSLVEGQDKWPFIPEEPEPFPEVPMQLKREELNLTTSQQNAIDCWVHGIAHLVEGLGRPRARSLMVCVTGYLIEENGKDEKTNHRGDHRS